MSDQKITPLGRKIVVAILGTTILTLITAFSLSMGPTLFTFRQESENRAKAQAELLAASLVAAVDFDDADSASESLATLTLIPSVTGAAVYLADGSVLATYKSLPQRFAAERTTAHAGMSIVTIACPIPAAESGSVLMMSVSLDGQWTILKDYLLVGLMILPLVMIFSYRIAKRFRSRLGDPLVELTQVVNEISTTKDYSRRVEYSSNDEIGILVKEFNAMLSRIEQRDIRLNRRRRTLEEQVAERTSQLEEKQVELERNNRLLLDEIQKRARAEMIREEVERINRHDLKSGLSLVIGYPELLLREGGLNANQEKTLKRIRAAGYRMLDMIRNHLDMFKLEKGIYALRRSSVDAIEILCGLEEEFIPLLESNGVRLDMRLDGKTVIGDEEVRVSGELSLVRTMFRNLIQNAVEASGLGDRVTVALDTGDGLVVTVSNPKAVPNEMRRRFFDKYTTHGKENGTGLGTYYAALIARTHGADITMTTDEADGTTVTIAFRPRHSAESGPEAATSMPY